MYDRENSAVVAAKSPNKAGPPAAEAVEARAGTGGPESGVREGMKLAAIEKARFSNYGVHRNKVPAAIAGCSHIMSRH
jgi:hypothetical protein